MSTPLSRRTFLGQASCAAVGSLGVLSTLLNLRMANSAIAQTIPPGNDYRALVCLFFSGGIDSYNVLFPAPGNSTARTNYETTRGGIYDPTTNPDGLALPSGLNLSASAYAAYTLAMHPKFADYTGTATQGTQGLGSLFTAGKAAFLTNVGTLVEPTTKANYNNATAKLPRGIYSHSDQIEQWHTSVAIERSNIGWAGRAADLINAANSSSRVSMNISLGGNNVWQSGNNIAPYAIGSNGSTLPADYNSPLAPPILNSNNRVATRTAAADNLAQQEYQNLFEKTFVTSMRDSTESSVYFNDAFSDNPLTTLFPGDVGYTPPAPYTAATSNSAPGTDPARTLGQQLKAVVRTIKARGALGMRRQTFFVNYGGWDHHDEVINNMNTQLDVVNRCLICYWNALAEINMQDAVTLYSASDFARTLTSNGAGSDHAWGGNQFILGGSVLGNKVYGTYPELTLTANRVVTNRGALIPDISVDQYFAELALWFGVPASKLLDVLPRLDQFYTPGVTPPVGFMNLA
jgi:uncharacterized protein (DUF1501 family)